VIRVEVGEKVSHDYRGLVVEPIHDEAFEIANALNGTELRSH
jgi:hypothetical protein